jgi:tetratricopeptide (TPR) repeat protein
MKLKLAFLACSLFVLVSSVVAQTEKDGFYKLNLKEYTAAKQIFGALLKINPKNEVAFYGMGEYYYYTGKLDSAKICYSKGLDANSNYAGNYAGLGRLCLSSNPSEAETYFKDAVKKSKKNATALIAIAKIYADLTPKNLVEAKRYINMALEIDPKNTQAYFMNGLIEMANGNVSDATLQFERAIYFDPNNFEAYLQQSDIMVSARNPIQAIDYLNKLITLKPDYWLAYKMAGKVYYNDKKYPEAIKNYDIYFKNVKSDNDVTYYAYSLFFNKQYTEAKNVINILIQQNPNDYIPLRLLGYISYETKDYMNGKGIMDKFFTLVPVDKILPDDYSYYGKMLSVTGNDAQAIETYKLALQKDSTQYQIYDELAKSSNKLKKYEESLRYGSIFLKKKPNLTTADYYSLGKAYYSVATTFNVKTDSLKINVVSDSVKSRNIVADSLKQREYFVASDSLFAKVVRYSPSSYIGNFWRARVNSALDKETTLGLAKPFYEKSLEILIKDPVKYKKELSEIYAYLGFYYYVKEDIPGSMANWKKLLEVDPENLKAQDAIKSLEKK